MPPIHPPADRSSHAPLLQGKVAVVTGSSSGIGRAVILELSAAGADVIIHGRSRSRIEAVREEIRQEGGRATAVRADISRAEDRQRFVSESWQWQGRVDIWINNAGADVLTGEAAAWSFEKKLRRLLEVDVEGTILLARQAGGRMFDEHSEQAPAALLHIGWDQAEHGMEGDSGEMFAAVKAAIMAFTRSQAHSLAPRVRVNCLAPGWIRTAWGAEAASDYWSRRAVGESLRNRWGTADDVARAARFLVSPDADFINGQVVPVNGGFRHGPR